MLWLPCGRDCVENHYHTTNDIFVRCKTLHSHRTLDICMWILDLCECRSTCSTSIPQNYNPQGNSPSDPERGLETGGYRITWGGVSELSEGFPSLCLWLLKLSHFIWLPINLLPQITMRVLIFYFISSSIHIYQSVLSCCRYFCVGNINSWSWHMSHGLTSNSDVAL